MFHVQLLPNRFFFEKVTWLLNGVEVCNHSLFHYNMWWLSNVFFFVSNSWIWSQFRHYIFYPAYFKLVRLHLHKTFSPFIKFQPSIFNQLHKCIEVERICKIAVGHKELTLQSLGSPIVVAIWYFFESIQNRRLMNWGIH